METVGFWAAVMLPLFDIPLVVRIVRRRSSADISPVWAVGMWATAVCMAPSAFISGDRTAIGFNIVNVVLLTAVLFAVVKYRRTA